MDSCNSTAPSGILELQPKEYWISLLEVTSASDCVWAFTFSSQCDINDWNQKLELTSTF